MAEIDHDESIPVNFRMRVYDAKGQTLYQADTLFVIGDDSESGYVVQLPPGTPATARIEIEIQRRIDRG